MKSFAFLSRCAISFSLILMRFYDVFICLILSLKFKVTFTDVNLTSEHFYFWISSFFLTYLNQPGKNLIKYLPSWCQESSLKTCLPHYRCMIIVVQDIEHAVTILREQNFFVFAKNTLSPLHKLMWRWTTRQVLNDRLKLQTSTHENRTKIIHLFYYSWQLQILVHLHYKVVNFFTTQRENIYFWEHQLKSLVGKSTQNRRR